MAGCEVPSTQQEEERALENYVMTARQRASGYLSRGQECEIKVYNIPFQWNVEYSPNVRNAEWNIACTSLLDSQAAESYRNLREDIKGNQSKDYLIKSSQRQMSGLGWGLGGSERH